MSILYWTSGIRLFLNLLKALFFTIIIELPIVYLFIGKKNRDRYLFWTIILINVVTNLTMNGIISVAEILSYSSLYDLFILLMEIIVIIAEALMYKRIYKLKVSRCILISIIANVASYFIGGFLFWWWI